MPLLRRQGRLLASGANEAAQLLRVTVGMLGHEAGQGRIIAHQRQAQRFGLVQRQGLLG